MTCPADDRVRTAIAQAFGERTRRTFTSPVSPSADDFEERPGRDGIGGGAPSRIVSAKDTSTSDGVTEAGSTEAASTDDT